MNKILSWKIDSSTYAYIYVPNSTSYISNRISEDSSLWESIIYEISRWDYNTYKANFQKMSKEVNEKYGVNIPWDDLYWNFADENSVGNVNIVLLSGKDGGGGSGIGSGSSGGTEVYEELRDAINKELDKAKKDIEEQNKRVEEFVEQKVGETIAEAKKTIAETEQKLAETREELEAKLSGATEALDKAAALFDLGEGNITGEQIQDALTSINECGEWLTSLSGVVTEFKTDYDAAKRIMGGIGSAEDALAGLFSQFGTTLNDVDNTVGTVNSWMVASAATIGDVATWYDVNASAVTEASSIINASAGTITDAINFISGDGLTTRITSEMNAVSGTIKDEIMTSTNSAVTNITNVMNGLSGTLKTTINRLDTLDGNLTSMGEEWNSVSDSMEQWINVSLSSMSMSYDLRDTWTIESGKLSTVSNLTAETDVDGNIIYYVSGETMGEKRVYLRKKDNSENPEWGWFDTDNTEYPKEQVYVNWSQVIGSYIQQQASSVTISVMNTSGLTAAIKAAIQRGENGEEESVIDLISDKVVVTGEMIAKGLRANYAQLGGINLSMGEIWSEATNADGSPMFRLDGRANAGILYATNAVLKGAITATSLTLGETGQSVESFIDDKMINDYVSLDRTFGDGSITESASTATTVQISRNGLLRANNAIINGTIYAKGGYIGGFSLNDNMLVAYDSVNQTSPVALINGSDNYKDNGDPENGVEGKGKLILAAGIAEDVETSSTRLYSNGFFYTRQINTDGGEFNGTIYANGVFSGKLSGVTGELNGVIIGGNSRIDSSIKLNGNHSIKAINGSTPYFAVENITLSDNSTEQWQISTVNTDWQNHNGTDTGQTYTATTTLLEFEFESGATITIPALTGEFYRYAPYNRTCGQSKVILKCYYKYNNGGGETYLINSEISIPAWVKDGDKRQIIATNSSEQKFTATNDGRLFYTYYYYIHLSTYSLMGGDKAYVKLTFNTNNKVAKITYPSLNKGTNIGPNGFRTISGDKCMLSVLDKEIKLLSPNQKYGLKITDSGVYIKRNSDWEIL